jgi:D-beta-D-heptose 7-phosphate kinase/D-beta-D-heptose 1-phosphate adenosyltransferase
MELKSSESITVKYHNIFDYRLTKEEAIKWQYKNQNIVVRGDKNKSRLQREKYSQNKLKIAKKAAKLISKVPTVLFVGITGSLAMMNADKNSDIDFLIITRANALWMTRLLSYIVLWLNGYKTRKPELNSEKDKLCLNMWLDESNLVWNKKYRNIYTAHEIAQIVPLINKEHVYKKFLFLNKWILKFWPKSVKILSYKDNRIFREYAKSNLLVSFIEYIAFKIQYIYMKNKITTEIVTPNKAIFHKNDWSKKVLITLKAID